jgi:threonine/homoserine/homoserine lactone efflux protein
VHTALAALGVGALLKASPALFAALRLGGAAYLAWLGARMLFAPSREAPPGRSGMRASLASLVRQGMASNVMNPKIIVFFVAFLPQFVDPASAHPTRDLAFLGSLYAAMAFPVKSAVGLAAGALSERLRRAPAALAWMERTSGAILVALGARLAFAGRP